MLKIYTKTGDTGKTLLYGGKRVSKADLRVEAYGEVDELNSLIGIIISRIQNYNFKLKIELVNIQEDLLNIGSLLANPASGRSHLTEDATLTQKVKEFEKLIDKLSKELPELKNFILPGGGEAGSLLHFARSVCRRVERKIVELSKKEEVDSSILVYFNRLSDLLFTMSRFVNYKEKQKEIIWNKN